jgi:hypothetical protein
MMTPPSRRNLFAGSLATAVFVLTATEAGAADSEASQNEATVRAWYELWVKSKTWAPFDTMLADDFTFSSANGEDHISKATFKKECWDNQINHINGMDLQLVMTKGDRAFVEYVGHTVAGNSFHNVEVLRIRNGRLTDLYCFFGGRSTFPSAVDSHKT